MSNRCRSRTVRSPAREVLLCPTLTGGEPYRAELPTGSPAGAGCRASGHGGLERLAEREQRRCRPFFRRRRSRCRLGGQRSAVARSFTCAANRSRPAMDSLAAMTLRCRCRRSSLHIEESSVSVAFDETVPSRGAEVEPRSSSPCSDGRDRVADSSGAAIQAASRRSKTSTVRSVLQPICRGAAIGGGDGPQQRQHHPGERTSEVDGREPRSLQRNDLGMTR